MCNKYLDKMIDTVCISIVKVRCNIVLAVSSREYSKFRCSRLIIGDKIR